MSVAERVATWSKVNRPRKQISYEFLVKFSERRSAVRLVTAPSVWGFVEDGVGVDELHWRARQPEETLIGLKRLSRHLLPRVLEGGCRMILQTNTGARRIETGREGGAHTGRQVLGIDGHAGTCALQQQRCREPLRAATAHRNVALTSGYGVGG